MTESKRYASIHHPTIQAVVHELYRLPSAADAQHIIETLREHFIISRQQIRNPEHPSLILWIKGFGLTPEDEPRGVVGHYAVITYKEKEGKFVLSATKQDTDYRKHPQRALVVLDKQPPNWGHPVLRAARKGKTYATTEEAQAQLALLHEQYPTISIPTPGKLYIMIYCSDRPAKSRTVKHTLETKVNEQGQFYIEVKENAPKRKAPPKAKTPKLPAVATASTANAPEPQGKFTAKVILRRSRKAKPGDAKP